MTDTFDQTPLRHHPYRWRLSRAGFVNVWHYYENTFDISGGRLILRGTNGSGKSRALEMLLPFLLDADRRNMGTGSSVRMEDLMNAGAGDQGNRLGYMWLELCREPRTSPAGCGPAPAVPPGPGRAHHRGAHHRRTRQAPRAGTHRGIRADRALGQGALRRPGQVAAHAALPRCRQPDRGGPAAGDPR